MHLLTDSPGLAPVMLYIAAPASLSAIATVPAVIVLPALVVVALKAPNTPIAAKLPSAPTQSAVSRTLVLVFTWGSSLLVHSSAAVTAAPEIGEPSRRYVRFLSEKRMNPSGRTRLGRMCDSVAVAEPPHGLNRIDARLGQLAPQ